MKLVDGICGCGIENLYYDEKAFGKLSRMSYEYPNGECDYIWTPPEGWVLKYLETLTNAFETYYVIINISNQSRESFFIKLISHFTHCDELVWSSAEDILQQL